MMLLQNTAAIFLFHKQLLKEYGADDAKTLGWVSKEAQLKRFEVLKELADFNHHCVLDAGCGFGDLRAFLGNYYPHLRYFGIEQIPALLDVAAERYAHLPETIFLQGDFVQSDLPVTDYIIANGSLNYKNSDSAFIFKVIYKLFNNCRKGFAFNLLSDTAPESILTAYNADMITHYCKTLTEKIIVKDNYWIDDFTVMMYHY